LVSDHRNAFEGFVTNLGIPGIQLSEDGVASFTVDDRQVYVAEHLERMSFVVTVALAGYDKRISAPRLLEANFAAAIQGIGTVGLDARTEMLCLIERIPFQDLSAEVLSQTLETVFDRCDDWSLIFDEAQKAETEINPLSSGLIRL
jgi:Tir chaperone protein (CesT) family